MAAANNLAYQYCGFNKKARKRFSEAAGMCNGQPAWQLIMAMAMAANINENQRNNR